MSISIVQGAGSGFPWQAIAAFIVGIAATLVAVATTYIQKRKLDLDLFDRRYEFYSLLSRYLRATRFQNGPSVTMERSFTKKSHQAKFLFPKQASSLIEKIATLGDEYQDLKEAKLSADPAERKRSLARRKEIRTEQDKHFVQFEKIADRFMRFDF